MSPPARRGLIIAPKRRRKHKGNAPFRANTEFPAGKHSFTSVR